jgi:DNA-binding transcriptional MocR family regulator
MLGRLVVDRGAVALNYSSGQGDPQLREQICEVMSLVGIAATADDVVVTVGSQQALDLVSRVLLDPGDVVLAESPSYVGALGSFASAQAVVRHVAMDTDGLVPDALREELEACRVAGQRVKFLYTIPNFQNPAGVSLTERRREELLEIAVEHDPADRRGRPLRPARLRLRARAGAAGP